MKIIKNIALLVLLASVLISCGGNKKVPSANPNHMMTLEAYKQSALAKAQMVESLTKGCAAGSPEQAAWCTALIATQVTGSGNGLQDKIPTYKPTPSKSDIFLAKGLDILGKALPYVANVRIAKDNNKASVRMAESRDGMMTDIITSGFNGMTSLGLQPTVSVGGDYITGNGNGDGDRFGDGDNVIGDGNVVGDGNVIGDGNGDGDRYGDGDNTVGDNNGDGDRFGDGDNVVGDNNGDGNIFDNAIGNDLFNGDDNGDDNSDDHSGDPDDGGG